MLDAFLKVLSGIAIAAMSSWITVRLSLRRYRFEKWWERKVLAYERVLEAFHKSKKLAEEHLRALYNGNAVNKERENELKQLAEEGRDDIFRASDIGSFILSQQVLEILARYEVESEKLSECQGWLDYIDTEVAITNKYMKEIIAAARADLNDKKMTW